MNEHVKTIQDLFQQKKNLSEADKEVLINAIEELQEKRKIFICQPTNHFFNEAILTNFDAGNIFNAG